MTNKLENLIRFDDFKSNWKSENSIIKESFEDEDVADVDRIEEIIPEGLPDDVDMTYEEKIEEIIEFLNEDMDEDTVDALVNDLRDTLLEMENQGVVDSDTTDNLDDEHDGDWISWIKDVIKLPDFPEDGLNNVLEIIHNIESGDFIFDDEDFDDEGYNDEEEVDNEEDELYNNLEEE